MRESGCAANWPATQLAPVATAEPAAAATPEAPTESPFFDAMAPLPGNAVPWPTLENTAAPADAKPFTDVDVRYVVVVTGLTQLNLMTRSLREVHVCVRV